MEKSTFNKKSNQKMLECSNDEEKKSDNEDYDHQTSSVVAVTADSSHHKQINQVDDKQTFTRTSSPVTDKKSSNKTTKTIVPTTTETTATQIVPSTNINDETTSSNKGFDKNMKENNGRSMNNHSKRNTTFLFIITSLGIILRIILLDIPVISLFTLRQGSQLLFDIGTEYLIPQAELQVFTKQKKEHDITYYHRTCTETALSTNDTADLLVHDHLSSTDANDMMLKHGVIVFPNLLTNDTATQLRNFILHENNISKELVYVIDNANRWSFLMKVDQHPTIEKALYEVLNLQPKLIETLETIMGPNPAIIEFTAITSGPGAGAQFWHQDVVPLTNGAKYGRSFIPSYSLFIPLQNTTGQMGATGICPGSHMCPDGASEFCPNNGFQVSGKTNNWPMGYGALVNQQLTHRGEAHIDYNASHRVVFILTFAPRPIIHNKEIESKLIGQAGSYSLHWTHWGHTLYDYQNQHINMKQPYRILRSLGLYNPFNNNNNNNWGWDYITVSSGRISCQDNGFGNGDLIEFINEKGGFPLLPKKIQGKVKTNTHGVTYRWSWINFLMDTIYKLHVYVDKIHRIFVLVDIGVVFVAGIVFHMIRMDSKRGNTFMSSAVKMIRICLVRLLVFHCIIQLICYGIKQHVSQTSWAFKIKRGQSFQLPETITTLAPTTEFLSTFPNEHDILIFDQMKSKYMYSYSTILNVFHPGNLKWNNMIKQYSDGYNTLPLSVQQSLRSTLVEWALIYSNSRILTKGIDSNWVIVDNEMAEWFCHQTLLQQQQQSVYPIILNEIDHLLSESKFGYWRDVSMTKNHMTPFLNELQDRIMKLSKRKKKSSPKDKIPQRATLLPLLSLKNVTSSIQSSMQYNNVFTKRHEIFPPRPIVKEPFYGAWMQAGDTVEAAYHGDFSEWYPGIITYVSANRKKWNVQYADGEVDTSLCYECVRPFQPYQIGEQIETRIIDEQDEYVYVPGIVQSINSDGNEYEIMLNDGIMITASLSDCRRYYELQFQINTRVQTLYPGEPLTKWFSGTIAKVNNDKKTYDVLYDDGDYLKNISKDQIRLLIEQEEEEDEYENEDEDEVE